MNNPEEQDDLWQLLGKAKKHDVSPFFAANVLRSVRSQDHASKQENPGILSWFLSQWRVISLGSVAAILLALNAIPFFVPQKTAPTAVTVSSPETVQLAENKIDDEEVITHLDELMAYEENNLWLENSPH